MDCEPFSCRNSSGNLSGTGNLRAHFKRTASDGETETILGHLGYADQQQH